MERIILHRDDRRVVVGDAESRRSGGTVYEVTFEVPHETPGRWQTVPLAGGIPPGGRVTVRRMSLTMTSGAASFGSPVTGWYWAWSSTIVVGAYDDWQIRPVIEASGIHVPDEMWFQQ